MTVRYVYVTGGVSVDQFLVVHAPQTLIKGDFVSLYLFMFYVVNFFYPVERRSSMLCIHNKNYVIYLLSLVVVCTEREVNEYT